MAFPGTVGDRKMEDLGFRNPQPHEVVFPAYTPLRLGDSSPLSSPNDVRNPLQRRFTTDSMQAGFNSRNSYEASGLQRLPIAETLDLAPTVRHHYLHAFIIGRTQADLKRPSRNIKLYVDGDLSPPLFSIQPLIWI